LPTWWFWHAFGDGNGKLAECSDKSDSIFGFLGSMFGHQTIRAQICPKIEPIYQDLRKYQSLQSNLKLKFDRFILATTEVDIASEVQAELAKLRNSAVFLRGNLMEG
jgi:hypothetical protein